MNAWICYRFNPLCDDAADAYNDWEDDDDDDERGRRTVVWINQEYRRKYWATRSSVHSFTRTAHLFACSGLLALLAPSAALICSLARSLSYSLACGKVNF